MTFPPRESLKDRALDALFGTYSSPEEREFAKAAAPPEYMRTIYRVILMVSACAWGGIFLWSRGWLPFVTSRGDWQLSSWFVGLNLLAQLLWEEGIIKYYRRRARARFGRSA